MNKEGINQPRDGQEDDSKAEKICPNNEQIHKLVQLKIRDRYKCRPELGNFRFDVQHHPDEQTTTITPKDSGQCSEFNINWRTKEDYEKLEFEISSRLE